MNYQGSDEEFDDIVKNESDDEFAAIAEGKEIVKKAEDKATAASKATQDKLKNKFDKYSNPNFSSLNKKPKIRTGGGAGMFQNRLGKKANQLKSTLGSKATSLTSKISEVSELKEDAEELKEAATKSKP